MRSEMTYDVLRGYPEPNKAYGRNQQGIVFRNVSIRSSVWAEERRKVIIYELHKEKEDHEPGNGFTD